MAEKSQINLWVEDEQKERWEDYLEESGPYTTLSGLIRASVETHISSEDTGKASPSPALSKDIDNLREEISRVRKDVSWLRTQHQDNVDISGLAQEVFAHLEPLAEPKQEVTVPSGIDAEPEEFRKFMAAQPHLLPEDLDAENLPSYTTRAIAEDVGAPTKEVEDAIEYLQDQFLPVVEVEVNGETHYFKEAE